MLLRRRLLQDSIGKDKYKAVLKTAKFAKQANQIYNIVTNPITLIEVTQNHFPNLIFCNAISHSLLVSFLSSNHISNMYELFSFAKDVSEGSYNILLSIKPTRITNFIDNICKVIRLFLLLHRIFDYAHAFDHMDTSVSTCTDYCVYVLGVLLIKE